MSVALLSADARRIPLADESVQCIVTSPPYWGLRKYAGEQELIWAPAQRTQADPFICAEEGHLWWSEERAGISGRQNNNCKADNPEGPTNRDCPTTTHGTCRRCGAWRGEYGLEPTVELYVQHSLEILRELRRVLRSDGVLFWNIGDSYAATRGYGGDIKPSDLQSSNRGSLRAKDVFLPNRHPQVGLKHKDMVLMPARIALAAQADGWWVRSVIIWVKPNTMPESVVDRPTDSYEQILMLTKSAQYFWDANAAREGKEPFCSDRNMRNVWSFATQCYAGAHFATFPEELPRRCILAASSARGACRFCGAPWERIMERLPIDQSRHVERFGEDEYEGKNAEQDPNASGPAHAAESSRSSREWVR